MFPAILAPAKVEPIRFADLVVIIIRTSCLPPPMAPSISHRHTIASAEITRGHMVRCLLPFLAARLATLAPVLAVPARATWLPKALVRGF